MGWRNLRKCCDMVNNSGKRWRFTLLCTAGELQKDTGMLRFLHTNRLPVAYSSSSLAHSPYSDARRRFLHGTPASELYGDSEYSIPWGNQTPESVTLQQINSQTALVDPGQ